jgi:hypothetical protein
MRFAIGHGPKGEHDPELLLASHPSHWQYASLPVGGLQSGHWQAIVGKTATRRLAHRLLAMLEPKWIRNIYIYIYTRFAYGTLRCLRSRTKHSSKQGTVRSRAISKGISKEKHAWSKVLSKEKEACSSNAFKGSVAAKHVRAMLSSAQWPRRKKKHARALISSAQRPSGATKSTLEQ